MYVVQRVVSMFQIYIPFYVNCACLQWSVTCYGLKNADKLLKNDILFDFKLLPCAVLYSFFWVILRHPNFMCWYFTTLCLFHLHRWYKLTPPMIFFSSSHLIFHVPQSLLPSLIINNTVRNINSPNSCIGPERLVTPKKFKSLNIFYISCSEIQSLS